MKRGQIALFVIVAILLIAAIGLVVYTQRAALGLEYISPEIQPIKAEIDKCFLTTAENGVYLLGMQGGYINPPQASLKTNLSTIAYAYFKGKSIFPSVEKMQAELSNYIDTMIPQCANFSQFSDFSITSGTAETSTIIKENEILLNLNWPMTLEKGSSYRMKTFSAKVPVRLGLIQKIGSNIASSTIKDPSHMDLSYLISLNEDYNMTADIIPYENDVIYSITDPKSIVLGKPYNFLVANGF